ARPERRPPSEGIRDSGAFRPTLADAPGRRPCRRRGGSCRLRNGGAARARRHGGGSPSTTKQPAPVRRRARGRRVDRRQSVPKASDAFEVSPRARVGVVVALLGFGCGDASEQPLPSEPRSDDATHESDLHDFTVTTVVEGLEHPWGMVFLPDGDILVTERPGRLRIVRDGALLPDPVSGLPDAESGGQGGQLDVALHPRFSTSRMVYLTYAKRRGNGDRTTMVARGRLVDDALEDVEEIFEADAWTGHDEHF